LITYYLVRHGTTAWVDMHRLHGITDIPLNENGVNQAKEAAKALKGIRADYLFSSPLSRALQTAEIIGRELDLVPVPVEEIKEVNFGWLEGGKTLDDYYFQKPSFKTWLHGNYEYVVRAISGETQKQFIKRVLQGLQKIEDQSQGHNFVLVAHSAVINVMLQHYFGMRYVNSGKFYSVNPASITEMMVSKSGKAELVRLNDSAHLRAWFPQED
jgi:broad specificity phosphatase PhoE